MNKKRLKFKKSRHQHGLAREDLFPKKCARENYDMYVQYCMISSAIPNPVERKEYIRALIDGLENEPDMELKDK